MDDGIEKRTVVIADERYDADRAPPASATKARSTTLPNQSNPKKKHRWKRPSIYRQRNHVGA
jgi:transposase